MKNFIALCIILIAPAFAYSQIKIDGNHEATVGYMTKLKLDLQVDDPKIACFPSNDDWIATKDFSGQSWIIYVPGKKALPKGINSKLFTFVIAGTKGGKTFLETFELTVKADEDIPDVPLDDTIIKSELYKTLLAAYKVSPDSTAKTRLLKIYETFAADIKTDKFASFKEADAVLKDVARNSGLQSVKDEVAKYLVSMVGVSGSSWDKEKLHNAVTKVIGCIKKIPD
jgi:hypothetical protein